jgi:hypothetical protein
MEKKYLLYFCSSRRGGQKIKFVQGKNISGTRRKGKGKGKMHPRKATKAQRLSRGIALLFL